MHERPIAQRWRAGGARAGALLAGAILAAWSVPGASAQTAYPGYSQNPATPEESARRSGQSLGIDGLPTLRTGNEPGTPGSAGTERIVGGAARGSSIVGLPSGGEVTGGGRTSGVSSSNIGPDFRLSGGQIGAVTGGSNNGRPTTLLRQRAAPPRRIGSPVRRITRQVTQRSTVDLRLSPVIQSPVSGLPLPTPLPLLGLLRGRPLFAATLGLSAPLTVDPAYAPLGIRVGTLTFFPAFTQSVGYDTNPEQIVARAARGSTALRSEGELQFRSDWSSSELVGDLRGGYFEFPENEAASRPNAAGTVRLRLDANRDTQVEFETRFLVDTQRAGNPDLNAASVTSRPLFATYGATLGVTERFNRVLVSVRGLVDRQQFEDARLSDGTVLIQSDRNANQYGLRLRAGYEISPELTPFVDALIDTRVYDQTLDTAGFRRDSDGIAVTGGAAFALTRFLTGEISAGLQHRSYVDPRLPAITAPLLNAAVIWSASPLTTVRLNALTSVFETAVPGSSGALAQVATLEVQHDLLRNLSITLGGTVLTTDYQGIRINERGFSALARLDYRFNRWLTFRGSYIHQQITSSVPSASFDADIVLAGLRVNP